MIKKILLASILLPMSLFAENAEAEIKSSETQTLETKSQPKGETPKLPEEKHFRTLSLNSSYLTSANSNRALGDFMVEFDDGISFIIDSIPNLLGISSTFGIKLYNGLFGILNSLKSVFITLTPYHEYGHFSRLSSLGFKTAKFEGQYESFFPFFIYRLFKQWGSFSFVMPDPEEEKTFKLKYSDQEYNHQEFLVYAGGLNNQNLWAEKLEENMYLYKTHWSDFGTYFINKISTFIYASTYKEKLDSPTPDNFDNLSDDDKAFEKIHDIRHMILNYRALGKNITSEDFRMSSIYSTAFSFSGYRYLYSFFENSRYLKPFEFFGIKLPDTSAYYTPKGISYKISSGYRVGENLVFPVAIEFVAKGDKAFESTIGFYKKLPNFGDASFKGNILISNEGEFGGKLQVEIPVADYFYIGGGVEYYNAKTLYGMRNIPHQENKKMSDTEFWIQGGLRY